MKKENGIAIVTLVIIVIVLLILAGVSAVIGKNSIKTYKDNILLSEAREVQSVINSQYQKYLAVKDTQLLLGTKCDKNGTLSEYGEYYLLDTSTLEKLGLKNPKDTFIVNYSTGEVINKTTPKDSNGKSIYLQGN